MSDKAVLLLVCSLVMCVALANLVRMLWDISITIGTFVLPGWTGGIFFVVLGLLSAWGLRATFRTHEQL